MKESAVVNQCLRYLLLKGCWVWRNNTGAYKPEGSKRFIRYGYTGSPDIIGLTSVGTFIGVECKAGKNKSSDHQKAFGHEVTKRGGIYVVAYSVDDLINIEGRL